MENDWLEALIALAGQLFCNAGNATYVWAPTNRTALERTGLALGRLAWILTSAMLSSRILFTG